MQPYPILFQPILKERIWGGRRLAGLGKSLPEGKPVGESWELADLPESIPDGRSVIANGPLTGQTLHQAINTHRRMIMGMSEVTAEGGFPLLIKYLHARDNLSVQVHPDETYVRTHPGAHIKSEAWFVIDAEPDSVLYKGVKPQVTAEQFHRDIQSGEVVNDLIAVTATPGDCHYLPSGTCHALGSGVLVAEVQTPSDTTFRVYDWGRHGRNLHVQEAMKCISFGKQTDELTNQDHLPTETDDVRTIPLVSTPQFSIERLEIKQATGFEAVAPASPLVWMMIEGSGRIETPGHDQVELSPGVTVLLPAELAAAHAYFDAAAMFLRVAVVSQVDRMIA